MTALQGKEKHCDVETLSSRRGAFGHYHSAFLEAAKKQMPNLEVEMTSAFLEAAFCVSRARGAGI